MKSIISSYLILIPVAAIGLAQEPIKPGTLAPKPAPATPATPGAAAPAPAVPPDAIVLSVGNEKITRAEFESLLAALPDQVRASAVGPGRRRLAEQLVEVKAMAQEAKKRKLDQTSEVRQLIALQTDNALASVLYKELSTNVKTDDAALHSYYDAHKNQFEQVKASHILIRYKGSPVPVREGQKDLTPEEALAKAQEIRKKLVDGADFAATAKAESDDTGTAQQGGSLGTFPHGQMVPDFEKAAFSLPPGQLSDPVKTQFGYHLIRVDQKVDKKFDDVKGDIEKQMKPQIARQVVEEIRKQTPVTFDDAYFGK